jgi:putative flippase GtrA
MLEGLIQRVVKLLERHVVLRFIISGGTSAFVDLVVLFILNSVFGIQYLISAILAFMVAFGVSFTLHKFWTFKSHSDRPHRQAILYFGTSLFGLMLNTLLMYFFVDHIFHYAIKNMKVNVMLSQIIVGVIVACVSFFLSHKFVFKTRAAKGVEIDIS